MVRFLRKRRWQVVAGSKHTLLFKDGMETTVPRHASLARGTIAAILKQAGVPRDEWSDL